MMTDTSGRAWSTGGVAGVCTMKSYYKEVIRRTSFLLTLLAFLVGCYGGTKPTRIGTDAPDFTVQDGAQKVSLRDLHGQVVVLNFWATWCPPCVEEMPSLVAMQSQLKARGVKVLAVSVDIDKSAYEKFVREHAGDLQTVRDPDQKSNVLYGTYKFPETYIIDRKGVIRRKFIGAVDWTQPDIEQYLTNL
jgi:peroxiredoxin